MERHGPHEGEVLSIMNEFNFSRRRRLLVPALSITVALAGVLLCAGGPAAAEDAANPNVIVDDSALDGPAGASANGTEVLPAPTHLPMSRLVTEGQSAVEASTPPQTTSDATFSAVPTTPIESTGLNGTGEPGEATAPAAGEAASAVPPAATTPTSFANTTASDASSQPAATAPA